MLFDPGQYIGEIEEGAYGRADRMRKGLQGERAEVERQALERRMATSPFGFPGASASTS